jgi:hypothetical protein
MSPQVLPDGPLRDLDPGNPLTLYLNPSRPAYPGHALPRHALLRAASAGCGCVLGEPPASRAGSGCRRETPGCPEVFSGLSYGGDGAKMPFVLPCDPLVERRLWPPGRPRGYDQPCNSVSMRVQAPPSRCRSESVFPRPATGPQRSEAGINGGAW